MGLIPEGDRRPRDWAYMVTLDRKDLPSLQEMAQHIRETHDTDMIEDFNLKCEQKLAGQTAILNNGLEIQTVTKTDDIVTNSGLQQCIKIIQGASTSRFSLMAYSVVNSPYPSPAVTDTVFAGAPIIGITMATDGWAEARGMKLFFGGISNQDSSPLTINEIGVTNNLSAGYFMLNHEIFGSNPIARVATSDTTLAKTIAIISSVIEFCPVA